MSVFDQINTALDIELTLEQKQIIDYIVTRPDCVLMTGVAGSGKSVILNAVKYAFDLRRADTGIEECVVLGTTGTSVAGVEGAITLANFLGATTVSLGIPGLLCRTIKTNLRFVKKIIIDEVSMMTASDFSSLSAMLQKNLGNTLPFGGISMIFIGDIYQLPPVNSDWFFQTDTWTQLVDSKKLQLCQLQENMRIKTGEDEEAELAFKHVLQTLRYGTLAKDPTTQGIIDYFWGSRVKDIEDTRQILCLKKETAAKLNAVRLQAVDGETFTFPGKTRKKEPLLLKIGARVQVTRNIYKSTDPTDSKSIYACNGMIGTLVDIIQKNTPLEDQVCVILPDQATETVEIPMCIDMTSETLLKAKRRWFMPLKLAYAITIDGSQGKTFSEILVYCEPGELFFGGTSKIYTAFSRCKSMHGVFTKNINTEMCINSIAHYPPTEAWETFRKQYALL